MRRLGMRFVPAGPWIAFASFARHDILVDDLYGKVQEWKKR